MDVFAESALPGDSPTGEALLASRYLAGVGAAQLEASQLEADAQRASQAQEERSNPTPTPHRPRRSALTLPPPRTGQGGAL